MLEVDGQVGTRENLIAPASPESKKRETKAAQGCLGGMMLLFWNLFHSLSFSFDLFAAF